MLYKFMFLQEDVLISIFQYLDFLTLTQCSGLCKKFWEVYNDPKLYTEVYLKVIWKNNVLWSYYRHISVWYRLIRACIFCSMIWIVNT